MSIQIVDNFQINVAKPVDSRIVASGSVARDNIPYKYEGLRVFDTSNGVSYVWYGGTWSGGQPVDFMEMAIILLTLTLLRY